MAYAIVAWLVAAACVYVGAARYRRVSRPDGADELARALRRANRESATRVVDAGTVPPGPALDLLSEVLAAPSHAHAIAAINEQLGDVSAELDGAGEVSRAGARISLAAGTVVALIRLATGLGTGGAWLAWAMAAFAGGLFGAGWAMGLARLSEQRARDRREVWNRLTRMLAALAPPERVAGGRFDPQETPAVSGQ